MEALVFPFYKPGQVVSGPVYWSAVCSVRSLEEIFQRAVPWLKEWMATRDSKLVEVQVCYGHCHCKLHCLSGRHLENMPVWKSEKSITNNFHVCSSLFD